MLNDRISDLNVWIRNRANRGDNVFWALTCPTKWSMFSAVDNSATHFNNVGQRYLADNVNEVISNFQPFFVNFRV